ncbi:MAG: ABC transporter substrate-binding protein [Pigmentiphaga sp.]|uniref:ABC transporter substrate-binding protein n=1 Tax=Pigmentiphaga sp. TaxID=1977564 RepID=UPI003B535009
MKLHLRSCLASCVLAAAAAHGPAHAADKPLKIGVVTEFSGTYASAGQSIESAMRAYMKLNGDTVAGRKVELILRDTGGISPENARRYAQELVTRDKVDALVGFNFTPNALAAAPIATAAKTPMIALAATAIVTEKSPYIVRTAFTLGQTSAPMATWAARNGIKRVFSLVSDYGPGHDAAQAFKDAFTAAGGQMAGEIRMPVSSMEFAPFLQRARDARADAIFVFVPGSEAAIAFMKAYNERGFKQAGIRLIGTGDLVDDDSLPAIGDVALDTVTAHHYSAAHDSDLNRAFVKAVQDQGRKRPNFIGVGAYDAMAVIYAAVKKTGGDTDGDKLVAAMKGLKLDSPRGPISIDPATRDIVQDIYIRKVQKVGGELYNVEFDKIEAVKAR